MNGWELRLDISGNDAIQTLEDVSAVLTQATEKVLEYDGWEIRLYFDGHNCGRMALSVSRANLAFALLLSRSLQYQIGETCQMEKTEYVNGGKIYRKGKSFYFQHLVECLEDRTETFMNDSELVQRITWSKVNAG